MISSSIVMIIVSFIVAESNNFKKKNFTEVYALLSFVFWFIAEILYGLVNYIPASVAYPSSADIFYLLGYFLFIGYVYKLNKFYKLETRIVLSSIITFSLFVFYFLYVSINLFHIYEEEENTLSVILSFLYPILDIYIAAISFLYYFRVKTISLNNEHKTWIFIAFGFVLFFIGDFIFGYNFIFRIDQNILNSFNLYFNMGYTMFGVSFLLKYGLLSYFATKYKNA